MLTEKMRLLTKMVGMIKRTSEKCYFYALLKVGYIVSLCKKAGFTKCNVKKKDSSCFIEARI